MVHLLRRRRVALNKADKSVSKSVGFGDAEKLQKAISDSAGDVADAVDS